LIRDRVFAEVSPRVIAIATAVVSVEGESVAELILAFRKAA